MQHTGNDSELLPFPVLRPPAPPPHIYVSRFVEIDIIYLLLLLLYCKAWWDLKVGTQPSFWLA